MKILIIKTGALGDVLRTTFIAQALKEKYKFQKPEIFWITEKSALPLFSNNPYIDELIQYGDKETISNLNFDIIINLEESIEICKFASSLKFNEIIGFVFKDEKVLPTATAQEWFNMSALGKKPENDILKRNNKKTHRQIIGQMIGLEWEKYEPFLRLNDKQRKIANDFLRSHNLSRQDIIIGINAGSADRWPKSLSVKKTSELINKLNKKMNAKILIFGGPNEIERNKEIIKLSNSPIIDTGCGNDLYEFPALISVCSIFITTDSLGLHVALALKRKTICLIGPTSPSELDMYDLGKKIIADSKCICCYKKDCKSMEKISIEKIIHAAKELINQKITVLITAFKEPNIIKSIESALNQKTNYSYEVILSAPDNETLNKAKEYAKNNRKFKIFKDPGKGKSYALNLLFSNIQTDILILTDGDVYISENSVEDIINLFLDPEIGCLTGRPTPVESKNEKYGYWANFLFDAAHKIRKEAFEKNSFIECSGYLFAFRKSKISHIPLDVAEDTIIPYIFWEKGYKIGYAENAQVYIKNASTWKDWIKQKTRTSKAHETLSKYADIHTTPRVKTFKNESAKGILSIIIYPNTIKEFFWTIQLAFARFYMWMKVFYDTKIKSRNYDDAWERVESTK